MKIILDQIEFDLPESIFRLVENAHLTGKVKKALEISKSRWNFQIKFDDALVECEIKYGKNCVTKIHCACGRSNSKHPCIHGLIAAYWYYKEVYLHKKLKNTPSVKSSFELITDEYTHIELGTFINFCFKLDKNLKKWAELLLSKNFAGADLFHFIYYKLEDIEKSLSLTSRNSILKSYREQCELLQALYDQSVIEYTHGNIEPALYKCFASLLKSNQWLVTYVNNNHTRLQTIHTNLHNAFDQMLRSIKAAELIQKMFEFILTELKSKPYAIYQHKQNIYYTLLNSYSNHSFIKKNDEIIIDNLKSGVLQKLNISESLLFVISYFKDNNFKEFFNHEMIGQFDSQTWLITLQKIEDLELLSGFEDQLQYLFDNLQVSELRNRIAEILLKHLIASGNIKLCSEKARQFAIQLSKIKYATIFFECVEFDSSQINAFINDYHSVHPKEDEFVLELLSQTNESELLLSELEKNESFTTLMKYDSHIFKHYSKRLIAKYCNLAEEYLNNHAGQQAFNTVEQIKKHIAKVGYKSHAEEFMNAVQKLYPERTKIINFI